MNTPLNALGQIPAGPPQGKLAPSGLSPAAPVLPAQGGTGRRANASGVGPYSDHLRTRLRPSSGQ